MDYQLNYFFEEPVDLIKKYGSEILSLLKVDLLVLNGIKNDKVEISLEEVEKISKILESTDFEINDYFLAGNKKYLKNDTVKYFTLLLQETVLLRALESKKSTEINQFSYNKEKKSALEHINSLLCDEKISLKSIKTKVAENILLNNYSEVF
nr:beta-glucosidase [uncultured bacterium]